MPNCGFELKKKKTKTIQNTALGKIEFVGFKVQNT